VVIDKSKTWGDIHDVVAKAGGNLLKQVLPFDLFEGGSLQPTQKSLAFRIRLQHPDHTLADAEITSTIEKIKTALQHACGAQPR
jgi:phenylalanyl-tRNA synthetase beta chain